MQSVLEGQHCRQPFFVCELTGTEKVGGVTKIPLGVRQGDDWSEQSKLFKFKECCVKAKIFILIQDKSIFTDESLFH